MVIREAACGLRGDSDDTRWHHAAVNLPYRPPPFERPQVRYCDEHLVAVEKVSGLLTVPGRGPDKQDSLLRRVQQDYPDVLVVHRLDMGTSGLVLFARDAVTQGHLGRLFQQRRVIKRYVALVRRVPRQLDAEVVLPLVTDWPNRPRQKVDFLTGRVAHTRYRVVDAGPDQEWSRVELLPTTGRSHQLRVHMAAIGHPILGDGLYADDDTLGMVDRLMLHAEALSLDHPADGRRLDLLSPSPF